jgi:hypothetical protein
MQLFGLESNAKNAASFLCDAHVLSQARETTQILFTALYLWDVVPSGTIDCSSVTKKADDHRPPYKPFSKNHPVVQWAAASRQHYRWVLEHADALMNEYAHRSGKIHLCQLFVAHVQRHIEEVGYPDTMPESVTAEEWLSSLDEAKRAGMRDRVATTLAPQGCAFGIIAIEMEGEQLKDPDSWCGSYRQYYTYKKRKFTRPMTWASAGTLGAAKRKRAALE